MKGLVASSGEDVFCLNMISMSINFWYNEAKKLLDICMCSGKVGSSQADGISEDLIKEISIVIAEEVKRKLR